MKNISFYNSSVFTRRSFFHNMGIASGFLLTSCGNKSYVNTNSALTIDVEPDDVKPDDVEPGKFDLDISLGEPQRVAESVYSFHFPHFIRPPGSDLVWSYYIDHSGDSKYEVGLATTADGVNFEYQGKVIKRSEWYDYYQASFAAVQIHDGVWYMLYEGLGNDRNFNSVCMATSVDGIEWEKHGVIIRPDNNQMVTLTPGVPNPGFLADGDVGTPTFFNEEDVWHVYFHMTDQDEWRLRIGYAYGEELTNLTVSQTSLIDIDPEGYGTGTIGARSNLIRRGEWYYMMYEVSTYPPSKDFQDAWWGSSLARARDPGGDWQKWSGNPLITNFQIAFGFDGPELLELDDKLWLYYRYPGQHPINSTYRVEITGL